MGPAKGLELGSQVLSADWAHSCEIPPVVVKRVFDHLILGSGQILTHRRRCRSLSAGFRAWSTVWPEPHDFAELMFRLTLAVLPRPRTNRSHLLSHCRTPLTPGVAR